MITIYEIGAGGYWTDTSIEIADDAGCPQGWTREALPELGEGEFAVFEAPAWIVVTEPFAPPAVPLDQLQAQRLAALADERWRREVGGTVVNSVPILTDRESRSILTGAYVQAMSNPTFSIRWKVAPGIFTTLDASTIIAIGDAVSAHVQACFDREDTLSGQILAAIDADALTAIDIAAGWPE